MSVMLCTSVASYPRAASQRRSHMPMTNGRALPMCARSYTVGPQTYMRTGPGTSGRSRFERVSVSESRIQPPHRLIAIERGDDSRELRTAIAAGQRNAQRAEIAADRVQLAHERLRRVVVETVVRTFAQLPKTRQRQGTAIADVKRARRTRREADALHGR